MTSLEMFILFVATFANVFLLGFQSKNVHQSRYVMAACTSFGISLANYVFVKMAVDGNSLTFIVTSGLGGSLGIMMAIWVHDKFVSANKVFPKKDSPVLDFKHALATTAYPKRAA